MNRICLFIGLIMLLGLDSLSAQTVVELRLTNQSGVNLKLLRGNNPGQGNEDGRLAIGETRTVNSVKGRVWSFMVGNQLVASYRTKQQPKQQFEVTNQMVRKAGVKVSGGGNKNMTTPSVNQGSGSANEIRGNIGSSLSRTEATQFLQKHNAARREVGVQEVSWSTELSRYAQEQADRIARTGKITHTNGTPYGENLGAGSGNYTSSKAVAGWYAEKQNFRPGSAAVLTGNKVTGHYTQMVWRRTKEIGAGKAVIQKGQYRGWVIVVGVYNPPGNIGGQAPY